MNKIKYIAICFFLAAAVSIYSGPADTLRQGVTYFQQSDFVQSLRVFRTIVLDPNAGEYQAEAYYWITKANLALGRVLDAGTSLEYYLENYEDHVRYPEGVYLKGRILFLEGDYENSLQVLEAFISGFEDSPFIANAYYWTGENLYALGFLDEAKQSFQYVLNKYPTSFRVEAARYKLDLIELKFREQELLKLLKWSHQESLEAQFDFQKREQTYEEAIANYQSQIRDLSSKDFQTLLADLRSQIDSLEAAAKADAVKIENQNETIANLELRLAGLSDSTTDTTPLSEEESATVAELKTKIAKLEKDAELVELKERALELKIFYYEWLAENGGN